MNQNLDKIEEEKQKIFTPQEIQYYSKIRIIQKNLVHFLGFPDSLLDQKLLYSNEYFGQFGTIIKIMIVSKIDEISNKKSNSAYITFSNNEEAAYAILSIDSIIIDGNLVRAFFGTTKYCVHFLNNVECYNKDKCMFLHYLADENDMIGINSKFGYSEHIKLAKKIINYGSIENRNFIFNLNLSFKTILPNVKNIYLRYENFSNCLSLNNFISGDIFINNSIYNKINSDYRKKNELKNNNIKIFKYKNKSRFFNYNDENIFEQKENEVPETLRNLVDELFIRFPFFNQFEDLISFKNLAIDYCKEKLKTNNDITLCINNFF